MRPLGTHLSEKIKAVAVRQALIKNDKIKIGTVEFVPRLHTIVRGSQHDIIATQQPFEKLTNKRIVINEKDFRGHAFAPVSVATS